MVVWDGEANSTHDPEIECFYRQRVDQEVAQTTKLAQSALKSPGILLECQYGAGIVWGARLA